MKNFQDAKSVIEAITNVADFETNLSAKVVRELHESNYSIKVYDLGFAELSISCYWGDHEITLSNENEYFSRAI